MNKNIPPLLRCEKLYKTYQEGELRTDVLKNITFTLEAGEMMAIVGSSGSGKSTLLHLLGGLDSPSSGQVFFQGELINRLSDAKKAKLRNRHLGFIYQFHHLLPDFTALENVSMPLLIAREKAKTAKQKALTMLELVGLQNRHKHRPSELSGGERQRVAIARALVNSPSLVLADEPTGNLDQQNAEAIFNLLNQINKNQGTTFLVVTHDLKYAQRLGHQLQMMDGHLYPNPLLLSGSL